MSDLRGSPLPVRKTSHNAAMRPAAPPAASAAASFLRSLDVAVGAGGEHVAHPHQFGSGEHVGQRGSGRIQVRIRLQSQGLAIDLLRFGQPVVVVEVETHGRVDPCMLAQRVRQQRIEIAFGRKADRGFQRTRQRRAGLGGRRFGQRLVHGLFQQGGALLVVENFEAGRHARLERKALQQPLAEGVDGLHLEAARRLDGPGKQPACVQHHVGRRDARSSRSASADLSSASSAVTHSARRSNTRVDISAAAALV